MEGEVPAIPGSHDQDEPPSRTPPPPPPPGDEHDSAGDEDIESVPQPLQEVCVRSKFLVLTVNFKLDQYNIQQTIVWIS